MIAKKKKRFRKEDRTEQVIIYAIGVVRREYGSFFIRFYFSDIGFRPFEKLTSDVTCLLFLLVRKVFKLWQK